MKDGSLELADVVSIDPKTAALLRAWRNSEGVRRFMLDDHLISEEEHRSWLSGFSGNPSKRGWVIFWENEPVGFIQLSRIDQESGVAEWGMYVGEEGMRGRGIGGSALVLLVDYAFKQLGLRILRTKVLSSNETALSLYRKHGFAEEGGLKEAVFRGGKRVSVLALSLSAGDWRK